MDRRGSLKLALSALEPSSTSLHVTSEMRMNGPPTTNPSKLDPLVRNSLREAKGILWIWGIAFVWVVGYCSLRGTAGPGTVGSDQELSVVWGMPSWVFWGVALPWLISVLVSAWFALHCIADEPLSGTSNGEPPDAD
jgi:hypothetical protein